MNTAPKPFIDLIGQIVETEMDEYQKAFFQLEGADTINRLWILKDQSEEITPQQLQEVGIAPGAIEMLTFTTGFVTLAHACITCYKEIKSKNKKARSREEKLEKLELLNTLRSKMQIQGMPTQLIEVIDKKYGEQLIDILNEH